jgi:protease I
MSAGLEGIRVAALVEQGFEQVELEEPRKALEAAGARVEIISPRERKVRAWNHGQWGEEIEVDVQLASADPNVYDALLLPGGVMNPDKLRRNPDAWRFVKAFFATRKPVAAICHAPWLLIDSGVIDAHRVTSYPSLQSDLKNAGANWVDQEVVVDKGLVTSRGPKDIPAFSRAFIAEIMRANHLTANHLAERDT